MVKRIQTKMTEEKIFETKEEAIQKALNELRENEDIQK